MPAEASSSTPSRARRYAGWMPAVLAAVLIWLGNLFFPTIPTLGLDPSWQLVLNHAAHADWVFGRDLVYTYGPWGWLTTQYYSTDTFAARFAWELLFKAVGAILIVVAAMQLAWPRRIALLAAALVLPPLFQDTLPMLLIAGLTLWAARPHPPRPLLVAAGILLAFLALQKFTYLLMILGGLGCVTVHLVASQRRRDAAWLLIGAMTAFLVGWLAAGQPLGAIPDYVRHAWWISSAYSETMFLDERPLVFLFGATTAVLLLALIWDKPSRAKLSIGTALTGFTFVAWKHGFVRADGHTMVFFFCAAFAGLAAPQLNPTATRRRTSFSCTLAAVALTGAIVANPEIPTAVDRGVREYLIGKAKALPILPKLYALHVAPAAANLSLENNLPAIRALVGSASIDQFGHDQAVLLLNKFNYRPRPVFQGFLAYSGRLAALNESAYLSPAAPAFTLARLETIDGRYPPLDDARLLPRLISDHTFVLAEKGFLLLRRNPTAAALTRQPLSTGELPFRSNHALPAHHTAIWAKIDVRYSWLGHLRRLLYKPPEIALVLCDAAGTETRHRFIVPAARDGFLLSPTLLDTSDLERLAARQQARATQTFRLETSADAAKYFDEYIRFELFALAQVTFNEASSP